MKPEEVEEIVASSSKKLDQITLLLPFLDDDYIDELALKLYRQGENVNDLIPFMSDDAIEKMAEGHIMTAQILSHFLPLSAMICLEN